jgi:aminopeptidase N
MYYKGGNLLHTIRQIVNDDEKWRSILIGLNTDFWHQEVTTQQVESYISQKAGIDLSKVFDQYLRGTQIPLLRYKKEGSTLSFKYEKVVPGFAMPIRVLINGKPVSITPTESMQTITNPEAIKTVEVDRNYYVESAAL